MPPKFRQDFSMPTGEAIELEPGLVRVLAGNPSPFSYTGTGTYLIGTESLAIIDPGPDLDTHFDALMRAIKGRRVDAILVTHTHLDHSPLTNRLKNETHSVSYAYGPHGAGRTGGLEGEDVEAGADTDFLPDFSLDDGDTLKAGGASFKAIHTPGHTSNHLCFYWQERNILFPGDHIMGWSTTVVSPPDGDMTAYINSLHKLRALNAKQLYPTHGPAIEDADEFIADLIAHRLEREAQILAALHAGHNEIASIVEKLYTHVDKAMHPAAARSVLSHLIKLVDDGKVKCDGAASLDSHYHPTNG